MDLVEFLRARLDEDEACGRLGAGGRAIDRRVLREVQAGRGLLADLQEHEKCLDRGYAELTRGGQLALLAEVRRRAAVYSTHPDYDPDWKP